MLSIQDIKTYMKENDITYQQLSNESKIPLNTLKNLFRGKTKNPRVDTMKAIERALDLFTEKAKAENLTAAERELLTAFRALNKTMQEYILQIVKNAPQEQEQEQETKNKIIGV